MSMYGVFDILRRYNLIISYLQANYDINFTNFCPSSHNVCSIAVRRSATNPAICVRARFLVHGASVGWRRSAADVTEQGIREK